MKNVTTLIFPIPVQHRVSAQTKIGDGGVAMRCTMIFDDRGNGNPFLFPCMK